MHIGAPYSCGDLDRGMAMQWFFDCRRVDVVSAPDNQFLLPAGEPEVTVGVAASEIAGIEPAPAVTKFHPDAYVLLRPGIAREHVWTGDNQLADLIRNAIPYIAAAFIGHHGFHCLTGETKTNRTNPALAERWVYATNAGTFREAVALKDSYSCTILDSAN